MWEALFWYLVPLSFANDNSLVQSILFQDPTAQGMYCTHPENLGSNLKLTAPVTVPVGKRGHNHTATMYNMYDCVNEWCPGTKMLDKQRMPLARRLVPSVRNFSPFKVGSNATFRQRRPRQHEIGRFMYMGDGVFSKSRFILLP